MPSRIERTLVRILLSIAICVALFIAALAPDHVLPAVAFGQSILYRLEVALLVFYGILLLVTPAFLGLTRGRLPTEISTRGAKFAEETNRSTTLNEAKIEALKHATDDLIEGLRAANFEIERLKQMPADDNTQRELDSNP
ncbi:MAG TPA: hypothetical protein VI039_07910 [Solirubrobacterales bacterium]